MTRSNLSRTMIRTTNALTYLTYNLLHVITSVTDNGTYKYNDGKCSQAFIRDSFRKTDSRADNTIWRNQN